MSFPAAMNGTNGTVSPLSGSATPVTTRNGAVSPIVRSQSPASRIVSPLVENRNSFTNLPHAQMTQNRMKARARQRLNNLTLDTQLEGNNQHPDGEEAEGVDEVISMSPAVRAPAVRIMRPSRNSIIGSANPNGSTAALASIRESDMSPVYFGQEVNPDDLVANNLENAFDNF